MNNLKIQFKQLSSLLSYANKYQPKYFLFGTLYAVSFMLSRLLILFSVQRFITQFMNQEIEMSFIIYLLGLFLSTIVYSISHYHLVPISTILNSALLKTIYNQVMTLPYQNKQDSQFQSDLPLIFRPLRIKNGIELFYTHFFDLIAYSLTIIAYSLLLLKIDNLLLILMIVWTIIESFLSIYQAHTANKQYEVNQFNYRKQNYFNQLYQDYQIGKEIKIYQLKTWLNLQSKQTIQDIKHNDKKTNRTELINSNLNSIYLFIRDIILLVIILNQYKTGSINIENIIVLIALAHDFNAMLHDVSLLFSKLVEPLIISQKLFQFISLQELNLSKKKPLTSFESLTLKNVSFQYIDNEPVLKAISLNVTKGKKIAIIGVNGAGKSTLIKLIMNLVYPSTGHIYFNNESIHHVDVTSLFAPVFQEPFIMSDTIKNNIILDQPFDLTRFNQILKDVELEDAINQLPLGIESVLTHYIDEQGILLSGGQMQRLMIARALYSNRPILVLDEPTSALDPISESHFYELVNRISSDKTIFFISHRLASTQFCNEIIVLNNHQIDSIGTHKQLLALNGLYAKMYHQQAYYYQEEI